jgi:hypothetical protein
MNDITVSENKVIGIGFHKTGTTTLGTCLKKLGYNHISVNRQAFYLYQSSKIDALLTLMEYYDSFDDWPWPLIYREAYKRFPNAKFILTTRLNEEVWFNSLSNHVEHRRHTRNKNFAYRKYIYGYYLPWKNKNAHIKKYRKHNKEVREFFADKENQLLEVCWEKGDGWNKLCHFLNIEIPDIPFPHSNKKPSIFNIPSNLKNRLISKAKNLLR